MAVLWNPAVRLHQVLSPETQATARALGVQLLPVEALGITMPPSLLLLADEVIQ